MGEGEKKCGGGEGKDVGNCRRKSEEVCWGVREVRRGGFGKVWGVLGMVGRGGGCEKVWGKVRGSVGEA